MTTYDEDSDEARTLVRWNGRRGRPLSRPHRHTVPRGGSAGDGDADVADQVLADGSQIRRGTEPCLTQRVERLEQARLVARCRTGQPAPTRPEPIPAAAAVADEAPAWPPPPAPAVLPAPTPPPLAVTAPAAEATGLTTLGSTSMRRPRWRRLAALALVLAATSGLAGYELAHRAGYTLSDLTAR